MFDGARLLEEVVAKEDTPVTKKDEPVTENKETEAKKTETATEKKSEAEKTGNSEKPTEEKKVPEEKKAEPKEESKTEEVPKKEDKPEEKATEKKDKPEEAKKEETIPEEKKIVEKPKWTIFKGVVASSCINKLSKQMKPKTCKAIYTQCLAGKTPKFGKCVKKALVTFTKPPKYHPVATPEKKKEEIAPLPEKKEIKTEKKSIFGLLFFLFVFSMAAGGLLVLSKYYKTEVSSPSPNPKFLTFFSSRRTDKLHSSLQSGYQVFCSLLIHSTSKMSL